MKLTRRLSNDFSTVALLSDGDEDFGVRGEARTFLVAFAALAALADAPALAADLPTKKPAPEPIPVPAVPSTWRFELTGYGWATSLDGNAGIRRFPTNPFFATFGDILDHFEGAFMGAAVARNDTFIGGVDLIWSRVGTDETFKNPDSPLYGVGANVKLTSTVVTGFGGLRIPIGPPNLDLYGIAGARYFRDGVAITLKTPVLGFERYTSASKDWIDPIVGFAAQYRFDDKWFINTQGDIGGWSDSATGQALGAVGYNWTANIASTLGYRVLYTYEKQNNASNNGSFRLQEWMYGPYAALKYSF